MGGSRPDTATPASCDWAGVLKSWCEVTGKLAPGLGPALGAGARHRLLVQMVDDPGEVAGVPVDLQLAVGAGALAEDRVHVLHRLPGAQVVDHVVHELEQLQ